MKPAPFAYQAPETIEGALAALADAGAGGTVLAGGQSLLPVLSMRLASPRELIDINRVAALDTLEVTPDRVRVGALARQARVEHDPAVAAGCPLLREALRLVAHPVIRNRGTVCGSLAHADPAAELPAVLALLGGTVEVAAAGRETRRVPAGEFFLGPLEAAYQPGDLVVAAGFPTLPALTGTAFAEVTRRHGDFALAGAAALVTLDDSGRIRAARAAFVGVGPTPLVVDLLDALGGVSPRTADWAAVRRAVTARVEPDGDLHASATYRRHLAGVVAERALTVAAARAGREVAA